MSEKDFSELEIDRYLEGLMDKTEQADFETRMGDDVEFRNEVNLQQSIIKAIRNEQLKKIVQKEEMQIQKQGKIRKLVFSIGSLAIAASLIGFFYIGYLKSCDVLANRYYMAYAYTPISSRGGETLPLTKSDTLFLDALKQLEKGQNSVAIKQLKELKDFPKEMNAATDQAVKWYLSLAYLKNGNKTKAKELLQTILEEPSGEFLTKAKELLNELEN
jgi:hypothetical protein